MEKTWFRFPVSRWIALCGLGMLCTYCPLPGITIDGLTQDWVGAPVILEDAEEDGRTGGPDLMEVRLANDGYNLYLLMVFASAVDLESTRLQLLVDADDAPQTGISDNGHGMDFVWELSENRGTSTLTDRAIIGRGNLIERLASSDSKQVHELAISLEALPAVAAGRPVHLAIIDPQSGGDRIPDIGISLSHTVTGPVAIQPMPISVKRDPGQLRVISWNALRDAPFQRGNEEKLIRILKALQPDIVLLQEVYDTPTETVRTIFENNLQVKAGGRWEAVRRQDCITVSRFPILGSWVTDGNIVSRHDTGALIGSNLLIGNAHLPCCDNASGRLRESERILQVIETQLDSGAGVPQSVLIGGDLNSGGIAPELIRLTTGRIPLEMASPRHLYQYDQYTWGSLDTYWGASRLDFLLFDPQTLFRHKAFVLDTDLLPADVLDDLDLYADDTFVSDHLPLVLDLSSPDLPEGLEAEPMAVDGSTRSAWLGNLNGFQYPDIQHESLGRIRLYEDGSGYWVKPETGPWMWTGPAAWPWAYFPNFQR